jgi:hypothetical protein
MQRIACDLENLGMRDPQMIDPNLYSKPELHEMIALVRSGDSHALGLAFDFVIGESKHMWHGRARANLCRAFKNMTLEPWQKSVLVRTIQKRLETGNFSQQFKDQIVMAIRFDRRSMQNSAEALLDSPIRHVKRNAAWTIEKIARTPEVQDKSFSMKTKY